MKRQIRIGDHIIRPDSNGAGGWVIADLRRYGPSSKHAGEEYEVNVRYPGRFDIALRSVLDRMIASGLPADADLSEAVAHVERVYATIAEACNPRSGADRNG